MKSSALFRSACLPVLACVSLASAIAAVGACGKKKDSDAANDQGNEGGGTLETKFAAAKINAKAQLTALNLLQDRMGLVDLAPGAPETTFGQSDADAFTSAKFRVSGITLCGDVPESNGDSCGQRPWTLFNEPAGTATTEYNEFVPAKALSFAKWTDFLDKNSTAKLAAKATYNAQNVGAYEAVVVNFYRAFQIKATVAMSDGAKLYTKTSTDFKDNGKTGLGVTYANATDKMATAPAEDATFFLPNGGKTFYLQNKFEISAEDVANATAFKMVLAYDPVNAIKGRRISADYLTNSGGFLEGQVDTAAGYQITAPFMEFSPVLARASETIVRETYLLAVPSLKMMPTDEPASVAIRLSLYYVKEDAKKSIRGVTSTLVYDGNTTRPFGFNPLGSIRKVASGANDTVDLMYNPTLPALKGFKRLAAVGDTGTVTTSFCFGSISSTKCAQPGGETTITYTLLGASSVDDTLAVSYKPTPKPSPSATATP